MTLSKCYLTFYRMSFDQILEWRGLETGHSSV